MTNYQEIQVALLLKIEIYIQVVVYTVFQSPPHSTQILPFYYSMF